MPTQCEESAPTEEINRTKMSTLNVNKDLNRIPRENIYESRCIRHSVHGVCARRIRGGDGPRAAQTHGETYTNLLHSGLRCMQTNWSCVESHLRYEYHTCLSGYCFDDGDMSAISALPTHHPLPVSYELHVASTAVWYKTFGLFVCHSCSPDEVRDAMFSVQCYRGKL